MERTKVIFALCAALLLFAACENDTGSNLPIDNGMPDTVAVQDDLVVDDTPVQDDLAVDDIAPLDDTPLDDTPVADDTIVPDDSPFETIGDFALNFNGQVNTDLSNYMSIKGGKGTVNFNYKGTPYSYGELSVVIVQLFPLAILQQNNVAVMWLESAPGLGAETKKVFAITFPATIQSGQYVMEAAQAYAFFGDIDINLQGGQFNIKCVRAAGYQGNLTVNSYTGTAADFLASGLLVDPAAAASQLPYPVCID